MNLKIKAALELLIMDFKDSDSAKPLRKRFVRITGPARWVFHMVY
jgi:hypothetical protein